MIHRQNYGFTCKVDSKRVAISLNLGVKSSITFLKCSGSSVKLMHPVLSHNTTAEAVFEGSILYRVAISTNLRIKG